MPRAGCTRFAEQFGRVAPIGISDMRGIFFF
jgi:hypothetical protein